MTRLLYRALLRLHPKSFRDRFGDEMLLAFDDVRVSHGATRLLADQIASLSRQWTRTTPPTLAATSAAGPVFHIFEPRPLPPFAIIAGGTAAVLLLFTVQFATNHWTSFHLTVGAWRGTAQPAANGLAPGLSSPGAIAVGSGPMADPWTEAAQKYIAHLPVLRVLDTNIDGQLSRKEMQNAPAALRALDKNQDGLLSLEECGGIGISGFMTGHPVLIALDKNRNSAIDAEEIEGATALLGSLDFTHDGFLTPPELLPGDIVWALLERQ